MTPPSHSSPPHSSARVGPGSSGTTFRQRLGYYLIGITIGLLMLGMIRQGQVNRARQRQQQQQQQMQQQAPQGQPTGVLTPGPGAGG